MFLRLIAAIVVGMGLAVAPDAHARSPDLTAIAEDLGRQGDVLVGSYAPQNAETVADGFSDLYFRGFEGSGMEAAIGVIDAERKAELEGYFSQVIGLAYRQAAPAEVEGAWRKLRGELVATASALTVRSDGDPLSTAALAMTILLREGVETILVVGALIAFLRRVHAPAGVRLVWHGVWSGLAASVLTALAMDAALAGLMAWGEVLEGGILVTAALVLAYVSHWPVYLRDSERWLDVLRRQARLAVLSRRTIPLLSASFLAVYREGAETAVFFHALLARSGEHAAVLAGAAAGTAVLAVLYLLFHHLPKRLPAGAFLAVTTLPLYTLAVMFAGQGVGALQNARLISATQMNWLPSIPWLGLHPTLETTGIQVAMLLVLLPVHVLGVRLNRRAMA